MQKFFPTIKVVLPHKKKPHLKFCHVYDLKVTKYCTLHRLRALNFIPLLCCPHDLQRLRESLINTERERERERELIRCREWREWRERKI